jgi:hypothetical protein
MNLGFDLNDWNSVEAIESGDFETLELGGHEIVIMDARLYTSENSGNTSLKISVDIAKGDKQEGYFKKQYDNNNLSEKKWPNGAVKYLSLKKESLAYTKGFVTSLEKSNNGFKFDTSKGWEQLKGLKCAGVFGLEEYEKQDGSLGTTTKLTQFRSLDKLKDIKIPRVKKLDGSYVDYEEYQNSKSISDADRMKDLFGDCVEIATEDLPF